MGIVISFPRYRIRGDGTERTALLTCLGRINRETLNADRDLFVGAFARTNAQLLEHVETELRRLPYLSKLRFWGDMEPVLTRLAEVARQTIRDAVEALPEAGALALLLAGIACCAKWAGA